MKNEAISRYTMHGTQHRKQLKKVFDCLSENVISSVFFVYVFFVVLALIIYGYSSCFSFCCFELISCECACVSMSKIDIKMILRWWMPLVAINLDHFFRSLSLYLYFTNNIQKKFFFVKIVECDPKKK